MNGVILGLDVSSSRIQMAALGHTLTPFHFVIRQFLGFFPGEVHLSEVSIDDVHPVLPWLSCFVLLEGYIWPLKLLTFTHNLSLPHVQYHILFKSILMP